jgi:transcriptional repressor NrdR
VKCNGTRQPFDERKLNSGFLKALEKRPVNRDTIVLAVNRIKRSLMGKTDNEISSQLLGEKVMEELRNIDHVAYVRFASVYRSFEDVSEFNDVIANLHSESSHEQ